jgi:hypothetical protein
MVGRTGLTTSGVERFMFREDGAVSRYRAVAAAFIAVVMLAVSSCSDEGPDNPDTGVLYEGDVAVLLETEPCCESGGGIGIGGVLSVVQGCVGFVSGGEPTVIVFPVGTSVRGQGDRMVLTVGGKKFRIGDKFGAGSRNAGTGTLADFGQLAEQAPASCHGLAVRPLEEFDHRPDVAVAE